MGKDERRKLKKQPFSLGKPTIIGTVHVRTNGITFCSTNKGKKELNEERPLRQISSIDS